MQGNWVSHYLNIYILTLIILSSAVGLIETVPGLHKQNEKVWFGLEACFVISFTIEFICRACSCPSCKEFWTGAMNYIDVLSIVPFYLEIGPFHMEIGPFHLGMGPSHMGIGPFHLEIVSFHVIR